MDHGAFLNAHTPLIDKEGSLTERWLKTQFSFSEGEQPNESRGIPVCIRCVHTDKEESLSERGLDTNSFLRG